MDVLSYSSVRPIWGDIRTVFYVSAANTSLTAEDGARASDSLSPEVKK